MLPAMPFSIQVATTKQQCVEHQQLRFLRDPDHLWHTGQEERPSTGPHTEFLPPTITYTDSSSTAPRLWYP
jgi:hypothetical protein